MIVTACQAQKIQVTSEVLDHPNGPLIHLSCSMSGYPVGLGTPYVQWLFKDVILSENDQVVEGDRSRYLSLYSQYTHDNVNSVTSSLYIYHALKAEEGNYTCCISSQASTYLQVDSYLPPFDFPKCSIEPELTVVAGTNIMFTCEPGDSNPPVNLNLMLHRPDGSVLQLGAANKTRQIMRQVTVEDNGANFVCHMTSDIFHNGTRQCSEGPLTITELTAAPSPSTWSSINALIAPIAIAIISVVGNVFLLWKNHQLKKIIASSKDTASDNKSIDGPYMELQKSSNPKSEEYIDLNLHTRCTIGSSDQGNAERTAGNDSATNYEVVDSSLKEADVDDTTDYDDVA